MMSRPCMLDRDDECSEKCPGCERAIDRTPDPDYEYEKYREEEVYGENK